MIKFLTRTRQSVHTRTRLFFSGRDLGMILGACCTAVGMVVKNGAFCTAITDYCDGLTIIDRNEDEPLLELSDDETTYDTPLPEEGGITQEASSSNVSNTHRDLPERCVETVRLEQAQQQSEYTYEPKANIPK